MIPIHQWLLSSQEPWTRYRTLVELLERPEDDSEVQAARQAMLSAPQVQALIQAASAWETTPFKRHNDAGHPLYALTTLLDFGLRPSDPGLEALPNLYLSHQSAQGAFSSLENIPAAFGGTDEDSWAWMACDAPTNLYLLLAMGLVSDPRLQRAVDHLLSLVEDNGWRCAVSPELGNFRGPGRKADPCPIANVLALKAISMIPDLVVSPAAQRGVEMLLSHWQNQAENKYYLFGIGTDFRKLKYPFVWYDILHVVETLSRFPYAQSDPRFQEMLAAISGQADEMGRYTASSMYQVWKGWSFADKKTPSPWLTFLVLRLLKRVAKQ